MILVLGAGPAGLAAALGAARRGHEVMVLDKADHVGGMAGSFSVAGVRVDHGSHRLHPSIRPDLLAELRRLLGDDLQTRPRRGRIRLGGRWVAFPFRAADLAGHLRPSFAAGAALDAVAGPLRRRVGASGRADTFAGVVRAGLGPTVARSFYEPYARKLWGVDASELSGELARRRVSASGPRAIIRRLAAGPSTFLYPRTGFGTIAERLADAVVDAGGTIELGADVRGATLRSDGVEVSTSGGALQGERLWSTIPLTSLARLVRPGPPEVAALEHRAVVLVYLVLDRRPYTVFDAHYFPEAGVAFSRVSEPANYRDDPDDPPDRTVLCAEVPCSVGDATWTATDDELAGIVADGLGRSALPDARPVAVEVRRLPRVYPVYRHGAEWDLSRLELWASTHERLLTFGRQGLFVPDNTHHVLAMGSAAAQALRADGSFDGAAWAAARDAFRSHVVED